VKKGYWVVAYRSISDESAVKAYGALAVPACQSFGGRSLTMSSSQVEAHEAGLQQVTVIVEFDSYDVALVSGSQERGLPEGASRARLRCGTRLPDCRGSVDPAAPGRAMGKEFPLTYIQ
jgi:uncharacterized protein (DUF1330 family)